MIYVKPTWCTVFLSTFISLYMNESPHVSGNYVAITTRNSCIYVTFGTYYSVWMTVWCAGYTPHSHFSKCQMWGLFAIACINQIHQSWKACVTFCNVLIFLWWYVSLLIGQAWEPLPCCCPWLFIQPVRNSLHIWGLSLPSTVRERTIWR